jgi:hypothetical protein
MKNIKRMCFADPTVDTKILCAQINQQRQIDKQAPLVIDLIGEEDWRVKKTVSVFDGIEDHKNLTILCGGLDASRSDFLDHLHSLKKAEETIYFKKIAFYPSKLKDADRKLLCQYISGQKYLDELNMFADEDFDEPVDEVLCSMEEGLKILLKKRVGLKPFELWVGTCTLAEDRGLMTIKRLLDIAPLYVNFRGCNFNTVLGVKQCEQILSHNNLIALGFRDDIGCNGLRYMEDNMSIYLLWNTIFQRIFQSLAIKKLTLSNIIDLPRPQLLDFCRDIKNSNLEKFTLHLTGLNDDTLSTAQVWEFLGALKGSKLTSLNISDDMDAPDTEAEVLLLAETDKLAVELNKKAEFKQNLEKMGDRNIHFGFLGSKRTEHTLEQDSVSKKPRQKY